MEEKRGLRPSLLDILAQLLLKEQMTWAKWADPKKGTEGSPAGNPASLHCFFISAVYLMSFPHPWTWRDILKAFIPHTCYTHWWVRSARLQSLSSTSPLLSSQTIPQYLSPGAQRGDSAETHRATEGPCSLRQGSADQKARWGWGGEGRSLPLHNVVALEQSFSICGPWVLSGSEIESSFHRGHLIPLENTNICNS